MIDETEHPNGRLHDDSGPEQIATTAPTPAGALASLRNAQRLLMVARTNPEDFTQALFDQLADDIETAARIVAILIDDGPDEDDAEPPGFDPVTMINRLPVGGRIILERTR